MNNKLIARISIELVSEISVQDYGVELNKETIELLKESFYDILEEELQDILDVEDK